MKQAWTKERIKEAIKEASVGGFCKTTDVGMTVATVARRNFGTFECACEEAGVTAYSKKPKLSSCKVEGCECKVKSSMAEYCEKHYGRLRRNGRLLLSDGSEDLITYLHCYYCGKPTNGRKFCSSRCATRSGRGNPIEKQCVICGVTFKPDNSGRDRDVCSDDCKSVHDLTVPSKTKEWANEWSRKRWIKNPFYGFVRNTIGRIQKYGGGAELTSTEKQLGYTKHQFIAHIESLWLEGMSWDNRSDWHIDHIIPVKYFMDKGVRDISAINALSNLRPLWAKDNISKGSKVDFNLVDKQCHMNKTGRE